MEEYAHDSVIDVGSWMFVVISCGRAPIRHNAEGQKVSVWAEKQVHVYPSHVVENEFVYDEVDELRTLETDEPLDFRATLDRTLVVY